ncbi:MAG TPA: amino acid adenylation domain-containing protein [Ignavibacteriales bacterium]|nr:amino acid adenylation domain-containing protein [Ignavibacteriales bacterium]
MMKNNIKELKQRALGGDLKALEELRRLGVLSGNKSKYTMAPLSFAQRRLWFIDKMDKSPAYNLPAALMLEGRLNIDALEGAFREIIKRHEILRTVFVENDGVPYQKIYTEAEFNIVKEDFSNAENINEIISGLIKEELNRCFDLSKGPLMACSIIKTAEEKHLFLFNMHHIISDGWSIGVLISELTLLYKAFNKGEANPLAPLKIQYRDYVQRHAQILSGEESSEHKKYWLNKLSGELPVSELTPDIRRPVYKTFSGRLFEIEIDKELKAGIDDFTRRNNASLFMFLVSAVNILIHKYTGKTDIITGSPVSGREQRDLEDQIGFYVNTIALRNEIEPGISFTEFLGRIRENCIEAYDHQAYPFDLLIEDLKIERDTSRNPLFEIVLSLQEANLDLIEFEGLKTTLLKPEVNFSKFDLHFNFEESPDKIKLAIVYNPDLYTKGKIERLGGHFLELLKNILNSPTEEIIRKLEIITPAEIKQITDEFNAKPVYYPGEKTIAQLFEEVAENYPDKPAVVYQGKALTYRELNEKANFLAHRLKDKDDLKIEEPVAIIMERSHELVISILGVLKAGGAYLPLDAKMPGARLNFILDDVNSRIILTDNENGLNAPAACKIIQIDAQFFEGGQSTRNLNAGKTSSNLAYIIYTSGSTGTPKGSMIEENSVIRIVRNTNYHNFTGKDKLLSTSSISFDATTMDLWGMLLNGGTLYLENTEDYLDPEKMGRYISKYGINIILLPTGLFTRMTEADQQYNLRIFKGLETLLTGGDRLPPKSANDFIAAYPEVLLKNVYGPTENTVFTSYYTIAKEHLGDIPIGKPVSNTTVYIFNEDGNLCPVGVPGELFIGGEGLSRGYVNRPGLNEEKFVCSPLNAGEILYRSGDIAQWSDDGNLVFLGRNDDQLKIRGFRIETGEIENIAAKFGGITATKVLVIQEEDQKELALYYTAVSDISKEEYKTFLSRSLSEYMLPKYFIQMAEFPLNLNGKVDFRSFPRPEAAPGRNERSAEAVTQTGKTLVRIFENILNVRNISLTDSFFSLGGHSLKAIKAVSAIQKELSVNISLKEFFANPDIHSLEETIKHKKRETLGIIPLIKESDYYDLSHAQKRLWVLDKIEKSKSTYNIPLAVTVHGEVDPELLQSALDDMVQRHESLRTIFIEKGGEPFQKIFSSPKIPVIIKDLNNETQPDDAAFNYITSEAHKPFTLSEFPLLRLYLIKTAQDKNIVFLNIHHIVCDGWSVNILIDELFGGYKCRVNNITAQLPAPKIQYKDYAYWLNGRFNQPDSDKERRYWLEKLSGEISALDIPSDFRRPAVKTYQGNSIYYSFTKELKIDLDKFNIERRSSLFMTLTAAIKVLLYKYSGKEDIIIGTPVAGRNHPDLENQIGYYVNTLALKDQINPDKTFIEFLEEVKKTAVDAYSHQMYPFDKLVEEIKLPRDTSRSPLFDIMIVLQNFDISYNGAFRQVEPYKIPMDISKYDLTFNFNDAGDSLELLLEYNTQLYKQERIEQMTMHLTELLKSVIAAPSGKIKSLGILSREEESKLLLGYNDTKAAYPEDKTVINLFEETASRYPLNTAVVYKDRTLTYSELDRRANLIARFILDKYPVSTGESVGVLVLPSEDMPAILLAILKTGGAYIPIDPEYPDERIMHILSESRMNLILTQNGNEVRLKKIIEENNQKSCSILNLDSMPVMVEPGALDKMAISTTPDTTAYVIFTSGSTGKPKGCPISHRNLVRLFINDKSHFDFGPDDVWIMAHSYCFDFSVWEMYGALLFGGKLIVPERKEVRDITSFLRLVDHHKVTVLNQTPGAFYKFIDTSLQRKNNDPLSLRYVIFGGDKLNPSKLNEWIKAYPVEKVKLINMYGITETTIHVTYHSLTEEEIRTSDGSSNVGKPLPETRVYILDEHNMLAPTGVYGEIFVAGSGLSKGYLNRPDLTSERFIPSPFASNEILYKSGDVGRWLYDGTIEYLERCDTQVQIRGFRVEINEIELELRKHKGIEDCVVVAVDKEGTKELAAYIIPNEELKITGLKSFLSSSLPEYMIPSYYIKIDKIPLTSNGKLDKKSLPQAVQNIATGALFENPANSLETELLELWQDVLSAESISIHDNFFDLGGNSILLVKLHSKINEKYPDVMELTDLFSKSRIQEQAEFIAQKIYGSQTGINDTGSHENYITKYHDVAIIGVSAKIGDSTTPEEFWNDLRMGVDFIGEIPQARIPDIKKLCEQHNIKTDSMTFRQYCYLNDIDKFDYGFFKLSPNEASLIDPGQRLFMETAYHALEDAGYGGKKLWGSRTGVFIGSSDSLTEYAKFIEASDTIDHDLLLAAQTPSILASRLSYFLNLKGSAMLIDTACSSSLVAVHLACQSIREGKIDTAIVGGLKLHLLPVDSGSRLEIDSSDSRSRSFDDSANGTGGGEGVVAVILKPLENALKDKDNIYAVIKGSDINQDGSSIGITAPDADAQADVIEKAWLDASIDPVTVSFIETHGTATKLGDPIEIDGITKAFRRYTSEKSICAIGAVKANIGHLDTAAGLAGLLKAVLSLKYKELTPLVHFKSPNRNIKFEESAAYINTALSRWEKAGSPLRCGVSSFGLSGTNCHVVLEEAPPKPINESQGRKQNIFVLSARSKEGLNEYLGAIKHSLYRHPGTDPESICYTLATGRGHYTYRIALLFENERELKRKLSLLINSGLCSHAADGIFYGYSKHVANNKRTLAQGEITEREAESLSREINTLIKSSADVAAVNKAAAEAYIKGADILWDEYYSHSAPGKVSLPGYPFEKKRCWVEVSKKQAPAEIVTTSYGKKYDNLLLKDCIIDTPAFAVYSNTFSQDDWLLNEHRVMGFPTLVGAAYLQMAYEAGKNHFKSSRLSFEDFYLMQPVRLTDGESLEILTEFNKSEDNDLRVSVLSKSAEGSWLNYTKFRIGKLNSSNADNLNIEEILARLVNSRGVLPRPGKQAAEEIVSVSGKWNCLNKVYWNNEEHLAELSVPEEDIELSKQYYFYPPLVDAALSYAIDEAGFLPYSFGSVEVWGRVSQGKIFSHIVKKKTASTQTRTYDVTLLDESGNVLSKFRDFTLKKTFLQKDNYFHELAWKPWPLKKSPLQTGNNILVLYNSSCSRSLINSIGSVHGVALCEVINDNYPEIFEKYYKGNQGKIIFILPETPPVENINEIEGSLEKSLYSAFNFAKYLSLNSSLRFDLLFLGTNVSEISKSETKLNSLSGSVAGLGQVLERECPNLKVRFLDIDETTSATDIISEINDGFSESYYYRAYRAGRRFIREIKPVHPDKNEIKEISVKDGGVYIITGGTGGIGLELADLLTSRASIKLVLINRTEMLPPDRWDEVLLEGKDKKLCRKIEKLREIKSKAGELRLYRVDVSDFDKLKSTLEVIQKDLGPVSGLIHAAGVAGDGFIFSKSRESFRNVIKSKIHGTIHLSELLRADKPDFFIMTSALTAIVPTSGQSDYTAANAFMDAFSNELNKSGMNALSVNLTAWKETGMAYENGVVDDGIFKSVSTSEGLSAFEKIMHQSSISSVILGEPDLSYLDSREELPFYVDNKIQLPGPKAKKNPEAGAAGNVILKGKEAGRYTELETAIAQVWGNVLGYGELSVSDNYYDLGGDSIQAIKIISHLEKKLKQQITIADLFNHLSILELAEFLNSKTGQTAQMPEDDSGQLVIKPAEENSYYPVSSAQRRLFILDKLTKDKLNYHIPEIWNIKGRLNIDELKNAFSKVVKRHEMLRTSFGMAEDVPVQIVHDSLNIDIPLKVMEEQEARNYIHEFIKPFDLSRAPLFRAEIIQLETDNHLILFDAHHIIIDGFSMEILKREILGYYQGKEPEPLRIQYRDFSIWQNNYYKTSEAIKKKEYWIKQFEGEIPLINLPVDYPRNPGQDARAGTLSFIIDEKLTSEVKKMSSGQGASTFMILLAAYKIVLQKYSRQDDIIVGVYTMGRELDDLSKLIGMFINNLPVRTFPKDDLTVREFLNEVKETTVKAYSNQDYPFDELVDDLKIKRDLSRSPLFDVVFSYMNYEMSSLKTEEMQIVDYRAETAISSEYDLMLYGLEAGDKISITIKYKESLFKKESIERFSGHFIKTLEAIASNTEQKLKDIDILLTEETERLKEYNLWSKAAKKKSDVIDMLKKSFKANSEKTALLYKDQMVSYSDLLEKSNKLANYLRKECSVKPNDLIGIMLERTDSMIAAMLGVIKSGAAYVGIDSAYPQNRIDYILNDSRAKILITEKDILQKDLFNVKPAAKVVDIDDVLIARQKSTEPVKTSSLDDLAYIIYTSGSTGDPKGVAITHKNLSVFLQWCFLEFGATAYDTVYAATSYCFDLSIFEIFHSLCAGKTIRILKSALEIPLYLEKDRNVLINTVPSLMSTIIDELSKDSTQNISAINLAGEQIPQQLIDNFDCDKIEVRNLYGPSEDTTYSTIYKFSNLRKKVLIGRPVSNTQIYIVDGNLKLVPPGHSGELCIAGDKLAKGYLFKEELTNEKFIPNPFGPGRLYRTGDLARWTESGEIEYLGRIDRQVKIRGFRIELGEIETNIRRYPAVEQAVVIAYEKAASKDIAAYIVAKEEIDINELKAFLSRLMPAYMLPLYFTIVEKIPLTPNGKIDVKALPEPAPEGGRSNSEIPEVMNSTEEKLLKIWKRVLETESLSKSDSFFDLGGHSLKALRLLMQINREFKRSFILSDIFECPSIAQFADIIDRKNGEVFLPLKALSKAGYYDVSHAQRRLWILCRLENNSIAYNIPVVYHIKSHLDLNALEKAFTSIIYKYESLRTYFIEVEGEPKQGILDKYDFSIDIIETDETRDFLNGSQELVRKAITEPFDLTKAPLIKVSLIRHKNHEEYILVINVHHIVLDEWSINILASNLMMFYDHFSGRKVISEKSMFMPSALQYKEYAHWHNEQLNLAEGGLNPHRDYWLEIYKEPVECLNLPADYQRPKVQTFEGKTEAFSLPRRLADGIKKLSTQNNTTLFITTLAIFNVLFSKYSRQNDVVIGTPVANREHPEVQDQIGFFLNTLALRNRLDNGESFISFLHRVKANTLRAFDHQVYPFDQLVEDLQLPRDLSRSPLFDVMLISQTSDKNGVKSPSGLEMLPVKFDYPVSKFDLSVSFHEDEGEINYYFEYNTALFRKERIENMFSHFTSLVENILSNAEMTIEQLNILSSNETRALHEFSTGSAKALPEGSIVSLIEHQASHFGQRDAVVYKRIKMNYEELNSKANKLARFLVLKRGIRPGDYICVMLDRSEWSVISMLAILKAGGVYVPVDPNYPPKRIEYILHDSTGKILITSEKYKPAVPFSEEKIIAVEDANENTGEFSPANLNLDISLEDDPPAYIIYTSGSTGEPKGVIGTHKCLLNLIAWQSGQIETGLKTLQFAPHSFDVSVQEILFSLASSGTLYMIENEMRYKMSSIAEVISKEALEILTMPYSALNLFLGEVEDISQLKSLKHVITSGEQPFINSAIERLLRAYPSLMFHNQYGPSETHVVTSCTISGKDREFPGKVPMGRPIHNTQAFILDKDMELVPKGMPGELYIGGFNVATGYINRPALTSERFIINPFGKGSLYKTGDIARWNYSGELEYLGRDDGQVKVRGFRIEPGEIESCLLKHPDVKESAVKLFDDDGENKEIVAYFTSSVEINIAGLKELLQLNLPAYMIPGYFVKLEAFPRTPSGKVDLRKLPDPDKNSNSFASEFAEPSGQTELAIAEVWKEVLKREFVSANENFFEIGGNSIKAIQVMSKVQKRLGRKTFLNLIFLQPTVRQMALTILSTEERLKNLETDVLLLNGEHEKKIFFLPPGIGYSFAYMEYAKYFNDYSVYGLNFIESQDPAKSAADILMSLQKEGEFYLFGHSAGGNMAFDVAIELQKQGRRIGGIILLDSYRQLEMIEWSEEEYLNDAVLYIEQNHADFLDDEIKDSALKKIVAYRRYLNARTEEKALNCPIIQIEATGEPIKFKQRISRRAWSELTPRFEVFEGFGGHMDMLKEPNLEKNALLTRKLIDNLLNKKFD